MPFAHFGPSWAGGTQLNLAGAVDSFFLNCRIKNPDLLWTILIVADS